LHNKHNSIQNMLLLTIGEFSFNSTVLRLRVRKRPMCGDGRFSAHKRYLPGAHARLTP
jgi:hypothetical protein